MGAVGAGRQRLKYRKLINSSFADLQKPQVELDGKACAAVGQNGLMALYDTLFSQLDITSSQLLVTDNDFKNADFRVQLGQTVDSLLALRSIPIFNENDAISTRKAPYELAEGLILDKISCPLGVLLIVFESRPDALVQIASLAIRSGNGLLLKGGKEARRSNAILHKVITGAIPGTVGDKLIGLLTTREEIPDLLKLDDVIDLVIPRGSNKLVSDIKNATKIPVLGHSDGICHVYVDKSANLDKAKKIVLDAKTDYPAACNAMETLLVHKDLASNGAIQELVIGLESEGVVLYGGPRASELLSISDVRSFHHEYSSRACAIEIVNDVDAAIEHIHKHGSGHTECIVADDSKVAEYFLRQVDRRALKIW